jgi:hypothetical protein
LKHESSEPAHQQASPPEPPFIQPTLASGSARLPPDGLNVPVGERHPLAFLAAAGIGLLLLGLLSASAYFYSHRGSDLAELAALPSSNKPPAVASVMPRAASHLPPSEAMQAQASPPASSAAVPPAAGNPGENPPARTKQAERKRTRQSATHAQRNAENRSGFRAEFRNIFGQTLETRIYASEKMRERALARWREDKAIIEPNGTLNEKYVVKHKPSPMPGFDH